jgi:glutamate-ammonia-ligase adenylyltransferase
VPIAGDVELGFRFLEVADAVRYPEQLSADAVREVARLKGRMERERMPKNVDRTLHLKLGPGGLTDVEWAAQVLQLQCGSAVPDLRTTSTLDALEAARAADVLDDEDAAVLCDGWRWAVKLRNAVVLTTGKALDALPTGERALGRVAQAIGYSSEDGPTLVEEHRERSRRVREAVDEVFRRCEQRAVDADQDEQAEPGADARPATAKGTR